MNNVDTKLILKYFDIELIEHKVNVKIKLILKEEKKIENVKPIYKDKNKRYPYSGSSKKYYVNYLGEKIGDRVWENRRHLLSKAKLTTWYLSNFNTSDKIKNLLLAEVNDISKKISKKATKYFQSDKWLEWKKDNVEKIKYNNSKTGEINSIRWKTDKKWVELTMQRRYKNKMYEKISKQRKERFKNDTEFKEKMLKAFHEPERKKKISIAAKKMWANARKNDKEKYYRMINSTKYKRFEINGIKMNSIEYQIALILNELKLNWEYEKIFEHKKAGYLPDFTLENNKLIIEAYGDFWHANPSTFSKYDTTHKKRTAMQVWKYDEEKKIFFESLGYKFIFFWENDIKSNIKIIKEVVRNETK